MSASNLPRPAARFWNRIARKYAAQPVADEAAYREKLARTAEILGPEMRVLEFGCGTGTTALIHAGRVASIDAIDFSSAMIAIAREKAERQGTDNVRFAVAAIEDWPVPEGGYDVVMAHSVLHLVADLDATLARARAMLKPGGRLVSSTVCVRDMNPLVALALPLVGRTGLIPRVNPLRADELQRRIEGAGFVVETRWRPGPKKSVFMIARAF